ncbi:MAG TPA: hypothetical protein VE377_25405 [Candidatus Dormibacteraeota bacterium]|nr:hypothetical protein [Candidatus Dormibacteraeota bacterium]
MFHPSNPTGRLFRSMQTHLRTVAASAGFIVLLLVVCISLHHTPYATASDSGPLAANTVQSARELNWRQSPSSVLNSPGKNSVTLTPCPPGVVADEPAYYIYISGTGTPEAVQITGGTCKGDSRPGTLEFTTTSPHSSGYVLSSASGGVQEASIAARFIPTNPTGITQSGKVVIPPGEYDVLAPISIRASGQTIDFEGGVLNCYTANDACLLVGDHSSSQLYADITLINPRGRAMIVAGTKPFIEVNAQKTRIFNITTRRPPNGRSFGAYVQVDDDQAFLLDGLDSILGVEGVTCNPSFCGAFVTAPGPFNRWSAVGWLRHLNLSMQCAGKGIDWVSGNGLKISDSVIQGWSVFGVRVSNQRGGFGGFISDNVYYEAAASCKDSSPLGNVGNAAIIAEGIHMKMSGLANNGASGVFPNWGAASGSHDWLYWVVPVHAKFGDGIPLPAGYALTNGSGSITGTFPKIAGASSYKILKMEWDQRTTRPYPEGTGNYLVATVQQSACATLTCQFSDNGGAPTSYTNAAENLWTNIYMPRLDFWPGAIVISSAADMSTAQYHDFLPPLQADVLGIGAVVSTIPPGAFTGVAHSLIGTGATPPAAANLEALLTNDAGGPPAATILKAANALQMPENSLKGRLNFGHGGREGGFTPMITLGDSNWGKTWATGNHRPTADVNDLDIGYEGNIATLYSRAQQEIREYIGKLPDRNPQEKLSASAKTFNVPVTINGDLTVTGKCVGCGGASGMAGMASSSSSRNAVSLTAQAAAIAAKNLCAATACGTGQYRISYYLDSTSSCSSAGNAVASLTIGWKDETANRTLRVPLAGTGISGGNSVNLGATSNFGGGEISLWSAGDAAITYSTSYAGCNSGSGTYALRVVAEKIQ